MEIAASLAAGADLAPMYRDGSDPIAIVDLYLSRIARFDGAIGAYVYVDGDGARRDAAASAARWRRGAPLSPLDGVPIAVKANIAVAGLPWTAGMRVYAHRVAIKDAAAVEALRASGAVILGVTAMDEAGLGATGDNPWFGRTHNPWRPGFTPGGSSSGSAAAVAAGLCAAALGTDTIGSIRIPAAYCGIFGSKPQRGRVSLAGVMPLSPTLDTIGFLARSAADCAQVMTVVTGTPPARLTRPLAGRTIAVHHATDGAVTDALRNTGAIAVATQLDHFPFARIQRLLLLVTEVEAAIVHGQALRDASGEISSTLTAMLRWGATKGSTQIDAARAELEHISAETIGAIAPFDAILLPATPRPAFAFDEAVPADQALYAALASCLGLPATGFPTAVVDGLPVGSQVVTRDATLGLAIAQALSAAADLGGHRYRAPMVERP